MHRRGRSRWWRMVLFVGSACAARQTFAPSAPATWRPVRSEECGFEVMLPTEPRSTRSRNKDGGDIVGVDAQLGLGYTYGASCTIYPATTAPSAPPSDEKIASMGQQLIEAFTKREDTERVESRAVRLGSCPGWHTVVRFKHDGRQLRVRYFFGRGGIYSVSAVAAPTALGHEYATRVLDSFHVRTCETPE